MAKIFGYCGARKGDALEAMRGALSDFENPSFCSRGRFHAGILNMHKHAYARIEEKDGIVACFSGTAFSWQGTAARLKKKGYSYAESSINEFIIASYIDSGGLRFLRELNGVFSLVLYDSAKDAVFIANDRFGFNQIYYCVQDGCVYFASEMKSMIRTDIKRSPDWKFWRDFFSYGYGLGNNTPLNGVSSLPNASILRFERGEVSLERYWDYHEIKVKRWTEARAISTGISVLRNVFKRRCEGLESCIVLLSGGYDSRCILASVKQFTNTLPEAFTIAKSFPTFREAIGDLDAKYGKRVAERLGVKFTVLGNAPRIYKRHLENHVWLSEGMGYEALWMMQIIDALPRGEVNFDGIAGDVFLKSGYITKPSAHPEGDLSNPSRVMRQSDRDISAAIHKKLLCLSQVDNSQVLGFFRKEYRGEIAASPQSVEDELRLIPRCANRIKIFQAKNRTKNAIAIGPGNLLSRKVESMYPFCDHEFVEFALSIPLEMKKSKDIYGKILRRAFPDIASIPTTNDPKNASERLLNSISSYGVGWIGHVATWLKRMIVPSGHGDVGTRQLVKDNPRDVSFLIEMASRVKWPGCIDETGLLRRVRADSSKGYDPSGYLEPLLYFALWHSQFVDGSMFQPSLKRSKDL